MELCEWSCPFCRKDFKACALTEGSIFAQGIIGESLEKVLQQFIANKGANPVGESLTAEGKAELPTFDGKGLTVSNLTPSGLRALFAADLLAAPSYLSTASR